MVMHTNIMAEKNKFLKDKKMAEVKNYNEVVEIASKHLGKVGGDGYKDSYDPGLLVKVPRYLNREAYGIEEGNLPFTGVDTWNAYEVSALTAKGLPVSGMLKIMCPADSEFHVESKSIKLYLNSFNMTKMGNNTEECINAIETNVAKDLSELLNANVTVKMFTSEFEPGTSFKGYAPLDALTDLDAIEFDTYKSDASQLKVVSNTLADRDNTELYINESKVVSFQSNLLRSNCRVTNQPDWGDVFITMKTDKNIDFASVAKYIVSHRKVSHFHEEICEMVFQHFMEAYQPEQLMVACLYTRRGGIDINPIRATHSELIPDFMTSTEVRLEKTLRQ